MKKRELYGQSAAKSQKKKNEKGSTTIEMIIRNKNSYE